MLRTHRIDLCRRQWQLRVAGAAVAFSLRYVQTTGFVSQSITITQLGLYTLSWFDAGRTFFSNSETYSVSFGGWREQKERAWNAAYQAGGIPGSFRNS